MMLKHNTTSAPKQSLRWPGYLPPLICLFGMISTTAHGLAMDIQSDTAEINELEHRSIHEGHVRLQQGQREVFADRLEIQRDTKQGLQQLMARGKPARLYIHAPNPNAVLSAQAKTITFYPREQMLLLEGEATIRQQHQSIQGERLRYFIQERKGIAESSRHGQNTIRLSLSPAPDSPTQDKQ